MGITNTFAMRTFPHELPIKFGLPITVHVGYPWPQTTAGQKTGDPVWNFARQLIGIAAGAVAKTQANRAAPKLPIRINRLRAMHGGGVLDVLLRRVRCSDILVFDITGLNANVLIEIGMALALKGTSGSVFLLQRTDSRGRPLDPANHPSDLSGYFFTRYQVKVLRGRSYLQLIEPQGFLAALRSRLIDAARDRGIWREPQRTVTEEMEGGSASEMRRPTAGRKLKKSSRAALRKVPKRKNTKRKP
jgi:hypothetical protein